MRAGIELPERVRVVRRFNRFYTQRIGVLNEGLLKSPFSLTEVRVFYELAHGGRLTAAEIGKALGLDPGYLSRILRSFRTRGLVVGKPSPADRRQQLLSLTRRGQEAFATLDTRSSAEVGAMLRHLPGTEQNRLLQAMHTIEGVLGAPPEENKEPSLLLRPHQPGDMGWVVQRHGALYAQEYGWDEQFEALIAQIVANFIRHYDPKRERCWMAEKAGDLVGSVFLVKRSKTVAQLRLLLVEPAARGQKIGARLVSECVRFARQASYRKITLWTNDVLRAARHLYEQAGFHLVHQEPHHSFGHDLVAQTWEMTL